MPYQKSLYNLLVPYPDGRTIIFNAFSGALGLFQPGALQRYHENKLSAEEEQTLVKKESSSRKGLTKNLLFIKIVQTESFTARRI